jgi:deazaflavin-dependent oxidoreductase (nitroreductase family)
VLDAARAVDGKSATQRIGAGRAANTLMSHAAMQGAERPRRIPKWLTRIVAGEHIAAMMTEVRMTRMNPALRQLFRAPAYLYRWKCGWLLGHRFLLLIHIGRRTGLRRYTVLEVVEYREEGPEAVVVSAFGRNANWLRNIEATRSPEIVIGSQRFVADHRFLDKEEAVRVMAGYERRNWFIAPIVRLGFSRFLGWRYHGSTSDRRRLVNQLPVIAFRRR